MGGTVGKTLERLLLWRKFRSGMARKASAALFGLVTPTCQITAYQGFGDSPSQPGNGPPTQFHPSLKGYQLDNIFVDNPFRFAISSLEDTRPA